MVITASRVNGGIIIMWPVQEAVHSVSEPTSRYTGSQHGLLQLQIVSIGLTCGTGALQQIPLLS